MNGTTRRAWKATHDTVRSFGVFQVRNRKRGVGRNPKTGVEVAISPGKTVRFKPGKELKAL